MEGVTISERKNGEEEEKETASKEIYCFFAVLLLLSSHNLRARVNILGHALSQAYLLCKSKLSTVSNTTVYNFVHFSDHKFVACL